MTAPKTVKPNKALRALIEQHPEQTRPLLDNGPELISFMNEWAKLYAKDRDSAIAFFEIMEFKAIVKEEWDKRQAEQAEASVQHA